MKITIYCPDENFRIHGNLLREQGIGGGKTAIISLAEAFVRLGNQVTVSGHVVEGWFNGVEYKDKERVKDIESDVLLVTTSHKRDVTMLKELDIKVGQMFLWLHGGADVRGIDDFNWDGLAAVSHFLKHFFIARSRIPKERFFVIHNGIDTGLYRAHYRFGSRDPYGIVFASHPVKGLDRLLNIVHSLRRDVSNRFHLDIYGGYKLWGTDEPDFETDEEGVSYKGLVQQRELIRHLFSYNFMVNIYDIPEGFGLIYPQVMRAGVIPIVSNVGGVSEIIKDGYNGFLISHPYDTEAGCNEVKNIIRRLMSDKKLISYIRRNAMAYNRGWDDVSRDFQNLFNARSIA